MPEDKPLTNGTTSRRWGCWGCLLVAGVVLAAALGFLVWRLTHPLDTTPPEAVLEEVEPDKPLFENDEQRQVTFVLKDERGEIPTFFIFDAEDQKLAAFSINAARQTPNERGVEVRFEAVRFLRDDTDPDLLRVRAVGIVHESEGKTPISLQRLESGEALDLHFHDEINILLNSVEYNIYMTVRYDPATQLLHLTNASGGIDWKTPVFEARDKGKLDTAIVGRKGEYAEKPLLDF